MNRRGLLHLVGAVIGATGLAMLAPVIVALIYQEWAEAGQILLAAVVTAGLGGTAWRYFEGPGDLHTREGFAIVGLSWIAISVFGTLPYLFTGDIGNFTDAFFETAAGYTTTGASVVPDPAALSHGIVFWRSLTQWLGGMGIIVLSIAILPLLGVGGVQLARAESPGVTPDRLTPRFRETAKRLWFVYVAFTAVETVLLWVGDMTLFEAINHGFTTMSTGGYSTSGRSLAGFSAYAQWVVTVFMIIAGVSFAVHYRALSSAKAYLESAELRIYMGILGAASIIMIIGTWGGEVAGTIRDALFTAATLVTTTGYGTADFGLWAPALQIMVIGLMFVGGMAGSTAGGVKTYRLAVLYRASRADMRRLIHSRGVFVTRLGKDTVPEAVVESVQAFFLLYMFVFMTGTLLFGIITALAGADFDLVTSGSAVASAIGNIGPGLGEVGPTSNYLLVPAGGKWLLAFIMIVGRLEIFPVLLLFTRELWRR